MPFEPGMPRHDPSPRRALCPCRARFFHYSTHAFSVAEAIELGRALGKLPPRVILYGIEGKDFAAGETLSPEVASAADEVLGRVREEIQSTKM